VFGRISVCRVDRIPSAERLSRSQSAGDIKTNFIVIALLFINTLSAADSVHPPELNPSRPNKKNILITKKKIKQ
jgi:hypothetical protein